MSNINLRKFNKKDLKNIGRCVAHKIIPVVCVFPQTDCKAILKDYIERNMEIEPALAIVDTENDSMLGGIEAILVDDMLLTSYYVMLQYQNKGICTKALGMFIEYIRKNNSYVRKIQVCINKSNIASKMVAVKNGFVVMKQDEFTESWVYNL